MSELVDVLDGDGKPMGSSFSRNEVHAKGMWHATVHIYVYRLDKEKIQILTHLRSTKKDLYPNTWDTVLGGHVQSGKTPLQTVVEEMDEEVGMQISPSGLVVGPVVRADKGNDKEFNHVYAYAFPEDTEVILKDNEVQQVRWMDIDTVMRSIRNAPHEWRPTVEEYTVAYPMLKKLSRI